jgi:5-hydroxyisourate hydrolase
VAGLTTHVLDTARGRPAAGMALELALLEENGGRRHLKSLRTNADGRTDEPLLSEEEAARGVYEIVFEVGAYFAGRPEVGEGPPFLDRVPLRFGISDPAAHYHVPLLASPYSYSTYRGS